MSEPDMSCWPPGVRAGYLKAQRATLDDEVKAQPEGIQSVIAGLEAMAEQLDPYRKANWDRIKDKAREKRDGS